MSLYVCPNPQNVNTRTEHQHELWTLVTMKYQYRFINRNKCTTVGGVDLGEAMHTKGQGVYGKSLHLPLNFAVNLKLLLKKIL